VVRALDLESPARAPLLRKARATAEGVTALVAVCHEVARHRALARIGGVRGMGHLANGTPRTDPACDAHDGRFARNGATDADSRRHTVCGARSPRRAGSRARRCQPLGPPRRTRPVRTPHLWHRGAKSHPRLHGADAARAPPRGIAVRAWREATPGAARYSVFTSLTSLVSDAFASPKSIVVLSS
jgi:hypothetical protein